jgi:hypothetical protein
MLPHIITSQIDEAQAHAAGMRDAAGVCSTEQSALKTRLLAGAKALDDMCNLARQLGFAAITNHDTIVKRRAS